MSHVACGLLALGLFASCFVVPENARPEVSASALVASQYNFRGIPNVDAFVAQTDMAIDLPTRVDTGFLGLKSFVNWDLEDDTGDSWFPDDHAGEPSQIDFHLTYSETYRGFDIASGLVVYTLQNPDDFPFAAERGETKELFVSIARPVWWSVVPSLIVHYDFDESDGFYLNGAVARDFPLQERFVVDARVSLGYSDGDQSDWNYGVEEGGFADLQGRAGLSYLLDDHTTIRLGLNASTIVDGGIRDWFDLIGIEHDNFWASLGVTWAY